MSSGTGGFQRLVRLVARLFYADEVPPPELPPEDGPAPRRSKVPQVRQASECLIGVWTLSLGYRGRGCVAVSQERTALAAAIAVPDPPEQIWQQTSVFEMSHRRSTAAVEPEPVCA